MNKFDSGSDERANQDPVRKSYRKLTEDEVAQMHDLKDKGQAFIDACNALGASRELSLAITNAEQAVMWAVKHVTA